MEVPNEAKKEDCIPGCDKRWLSMVRDMLKQNSITQTEFSQAVESLLTKGQGKYRKVLLVGRQDSAAERLSCSVH